MTFRVRLTLLFVGAIAALAALSSTAIYEIVKGQVAAQDRRAAHALASTAAIAETAEIALDRMTAPGDFIWLIAPNGRVIAQSFKARGGTEADVRATVAVGTAHGMVTSSAPTAGGGRAVVLYNTSRSTQALNTVRLTLIYVDIAVIAIAAMVGVLLASISLRPVEQMRTEADRIPGDALDRRLPEGRNDELGRLARAFNRLLARAQRSSDEQHQFIADASHELRTPVMAIEGHARILTRALQRADLNQVEASAQIVQQSSHRLALTIRELLLLAETDSAPASTDDVRLDLVVDDAVTEMRATAPDRQIRLSAVPAHARGDQSRLRELVTILLDNAVKYSPPGSPIDVGVTCAEDGAPTVTVRDYGPGVTPSDADRVFGRFARGSAAPGVAGSGLGLAIAHAVAERHRGHIELVNADGGGALARVRFPPPVLHDSD